MDQILTEFIARTGAEISLARDILAEKNWDIDSALDAYSSLIQLKNSSPSSSWTSTIVLNGNAAPNNFPESSQREFGEKRMRGFSATVENVGLISSVRNQLSRSMNSESNGVDLPDFSIKKKFSRGNNSKESSTSTKNGVNGNSSCYIETSTYTFTLPNLNDFEENFRAFLEKDLIETASLKALEGSGHLNWWAAAGLCQKLWPLATTGDGNCLLHAASLGMWGFHDRQLMLRKALHEILTKGSRRHALWRRWRWQQTQQNKAADLIYSEEEWRVEWNNIVRLASPQPRSKPNSAEPLSDADQISSTPLPNQVADSSDDSADMVYESLEELHVFALAHVLKRPVIVIADTVLRDSGGEAFAPIPFGGIYLPLECSPAECHRSPLVLCYDAAHFSALVVMNGQQKGDKQAATLVPITDKERRLLPLHFASDPGPDFTWWTDEEDSKIAAAATLNEKAKLDLVTRYVGLCKVPSKKAKSASLGNGVPSGRFGSHDGSFGHQDGHALATIPREVTGSTGALETRSGSLKLESPSPSKFVWSRLARTIKRRLQSKTRSLMKESKLYDKNGFITHGDIPFRVNGRNRFTYEVITLADLVDATIIVGAQLHASPQPQFMQKMVENYLKLARERFEMEQEKTSQPGRPLRRERISRSFSASNVFVRCMNGDCPGQASHQTNYLCENCFRKQKQLMESFTVTTNQPVVSRSTLPPNSTISQTPPTFVVASASNCYNNNRSSSAPFNKYCTLPATMTSSANESIDNAARTNNSDSVAVSIARSTFYGFSSVRRAAYGRSASPVYCTARSKFYTMTGGGGGGGGTMVNGEDAPKLTVVEPLTNGDTSTLNGINYTPTHKNNYTKPCRSVETRYGVTAITNPHGVTHYFIPSNSSTSPSSPDSTSTTLTSPDCKTMDEDSLYPLNIGGRILTDGYATRL